MARVKYSSGLTLNLGNYESARIDIGAEITCDIDEKSMEEAYEKIKDFVQLKVEEEKFRWQQ